MASSALPQAIISSGGPFHAYHLARGAQAGGCLRRFITTRFDRREVGLDRARVREIWSPWLMATAVQLLPGASAPYWSYVLGDNLFDLLSRRWVDGGDLFHVFNHYGLFTMRHAKRRGMTTIVERSAGHPLTQVRLLRAEYERFGLRYPGENPLLLRKQLQEYVEADYVMVPSDFVWRTMADNGVPEAKLRRVHLGFDPRRFSPGQKQQPIFRVIYVGALSLQKGIPYLLEAWQMLDLPTERCELLLVGQPFADAKVFLSRYFGAYRHLPFVPHDQLPALYHSASVFVLPSLQDGFGMVVYEAAACGLPVVITENVGATVRDGQDGFVVPIRNPEALAEKLLYFYEHEAERRAMGNSAREYVSQFTWTRYHAELIDHYRAIERDLQARPHD